jgi:ribosomal-protein-alanine N-acetyltransferase
MNGFPILETRRLVLRNLLPSDEGSLFAIYSNPEVTRFCDIPTLANRREAGALLQLFHSEFEKTSGIRWAITEKASPLVIGLCGVAWYRHNSSALLSYDLNQTYWNRGIMTEATKAVVKYAFETAVINRVTATTLVDNVASIRVLEKVGFREEGILREWGLWKGQFKDLRCFSLLGKDLALVRRAVSTGRHALAS